MNFPNLNNVRATFSAQTQTATTAVRSANVAGIATSAMKSVATAFTGDAFGVENAHDSSTAKLAFFVQNGLLGAFAAFNPLVPAALAAMGAPEAFGHEGAAKNSAIRLIATAALTTGLFFVAGPFAALAGVLPKVYADYRDTFRSKPATTPEPAATPEA